MKQKQKNLPVHYNQILLNQLSQFDHKYECRTDQQTAGFILHC